MAYLTGDSIPEETVCKVVRIPDDPAFRRALRGALLELTYLHNWQKFGDVEPEDMAQAFLEAFWTFEDDECIEPEIVIYPTYASLNPLLMEWIIQSGSVSAFQAAMPYGMFTLPSAALNGDFLLSTFYLGAGEYNFDVWYSRSSANGKLDIYIDTVKEVDQLDTFLGTGTVKSSHTVTITGDGNHLIQIIANGKHASSTGYQIRLGALVFWQTQEGAGI